MLAQPHTGSPHLEHPAPRAHLSTDSSPWIRHPSQHPQSALGFTLSLGESTGPVRYNWRCLPLEDLTDQLTCSEGLSILPHSAVILLTLLVCSLSANSSSLDPPTAMQPSRPGSLAVKRFSVSSSVRALTAQ